MNEPDELIDEDGCPTDEALEHLQTFTGSTEELVAYVRSLMHNGRTVLEDATDDFGRPQKRLTLVTGGWSGCEAVIGTLRETMFQVLFWESSHRGGKHTFTITPDQWAMRLPWSLQRPSGA